jgi:hypothetical protein
MFDPCLYRGFPAIRCEGIIIIIIMSFTETIEIRASEIG